MLFTMMGEVLIKVNGNKIDYSYTELNTTGQRFRVDERYEIVLDQLNLLGSSVTIECCLINSVFELNGYPETGERLEMISFLEGSYKCSIGVEGDIIGLKYEYNVDGLDICISDTSDIKRMVFRIACVNMQDIDNEEIYTWFAADPTV